MTPHLVVCQNGERTAKVDLGRGELTYVTADIEGLLNLSVRGDFKAVKVLQASVIAPDGKTYSLRTQGEQPPSHPGTFVGFFGIEHDGVINEFSIGHWKVRMSIEIPTIRQHTDAANELERIPIWTMQKQRMATGPMTSSAPAKK